MKPRKLLFVFVLVLALSACNLPSNLPPTETPTLTINTPAVTPATATPTQTLVPTNTPPATATSTPTVPVAFARDVPVNCRLGPSTGWIAVSSLNIGVSSQIIGKTGDASWWLVADPLSSGRNCWVSASVTNTGGNLAGIPVAPAPNATVTDVRVDIDPKTINVAGCVGPIQPSKITGTIETNGPTSVTWHFETQQSGAMPNQTMQFDAFGPKTFTVDYTPPLTAGTYWVRLIVTSPNNMQAEVKYTITCP